MASPQKQLVQSKGIYHGLPAYPEGGAPQTALITGANGISGYYMTRVLAESPERWSKIYCLSRRPPAIEGGLPKNAEFIQCDFLQSPEQIGDTLKAKGVTHVDHVFFFAYIQPPPKPGGGIWSDADEMVRINELILQNFLGALDHASLQPNRIMLQTGAKNYGINNGPAKLPMTESDPRPNLDKNFYFYQEDVLSAWVRKTPHTRYTVAMPSFILGAVPNAAMNAAYPLAVYCAVTKHLGEELVFPAGFDAWTNPQMQSTARMNAYLEEWLAVGLAEGECARETGVGKGGGGEGGVYGDEEGWGKFNAVDGSLWAWEDTWPKLAEWWEVGWKGPELEGLKEVELGKGPRGYGPSNKMQVNFSTVQWAKEERVRKAWREIAAREGLLEKELADVERVFGFLDGMLTQSFPTLFSSKKVRRLGFHGFVDSEEALLEMFRELAHIKMIPRVPEVRVKLA